MLIFNDDLQRFQLDPLIVFVFINAGIIGAMLDFVQTHNVAITPFLGLLAVWCRQRWDKMPALKIKWYIVAGFCFGLAHPLMVPFAVLLAWKMPAIYRGGYRVRVKCYKFTIWWLKE